MNIIKNVTNGWKIAIKEIDFLDSAMYVVAPVVTILVAIIIFLEVNKELWK